MNFKGIEIQPPEVPSVTLPSVTTTSSNLDIGPRGNPPLTSTPATENPLTTSSTPPMAKIRFRVPHVTSKELTEPAVNVHSEKVPNIPKLQQMTPLAVSTTTLEPVPQPASYTRPAPSSVVGSVSNESLVAIMSSMERMTVSHDLPPVQVQKFDGSPERYPAFRQRFKQLVETRPLDDSVKMTRLLQFLEGPALLAVQRYEPMSGGMSKALKTLEDRFGQAFQVVRACIESLTKGPATTERIVNKAIYPIDPSIHRKKLVLCTCRTQRQQLGAQESLHTSGIAHQLTKERPSINFKIKPQSIRQ